MFNRMEYHSWPFIVWNIVCNITISLNNKSNDRLVIVLHIAIINNLFKRVPKSYMSLSKPTTHHVISSSEHFSRCGFATLEILLVETKIGIGHLTPFPIIPKWVINVDEKTPLKEGSSKDEPSLKEHQPLHCLNHLLERLKPKSTLN